MVKGVKRDGETWLKKQSASVFYRLSLRPTEVSTSPTPGFQVDEAPGARGPFAIAEQQRFIRGMVAWIGLR
jgi:dolichol-phosphate mannosyltransferase